MLLVAIGLLIAIPGTAATLAAFGPGDLAPATRLAAIFGLGYAAAGSCSFVLAAAHVFWLASFLPLWLVVTAGLWWLALRRFSLREQGRALWSDLLRDRLPLLLGALVVLVMIIFKLPFLHVVAGGAHYVYYLNGIEIANAHGVPSQTLEYGQSWPSATDKIFLDAFTGVVPMLSSNPLLGPGVLLVLSYAGAAIGLWATAWELGLRRTGALLPLLVLANLRFLDPGMASGFDVYRAENFGIGVAFCALPLGIVAIREGSWRRAAIAGVTLAAAAGTHLVPVVVVVFVLIAVGLGELLRGSAGRARRVLVRDFVAMGGIGGVIYVVIRIFAGGTLGLGGASNQSSYNAIKTWFDPTEYLYTGDFASKNPPERDHFFVSGRAIIDNVLETATHTGWDTTLCVAVIAGTLAVAVLLFFTARDRLGTVGIAAFGTLVMILVLCLGFSFYYHVWIDGTFGYRRMSVYDSIPLVMAGLGLVESVLLLLEMVRVKALLDRVRESLSLEDLRAKITFQGSVAAVVPVVALTAWVGPSSMPTSMSIFNPASHGGMQTASSDLTAFANWVRTSTPCGARFLVNSRPEGTMTSLTARFDLSEGMGSFLRPGTLTYVTDLMLSARSFYADPLQNESFLRKEHINYVVVANNTLLIGYPGPIALDGQAEMDKAPFLRQAWTDGATTVYQVKGAPTLPVSPLLQGPYLHCGTSKIGF